jgi:hypothetical protein
MKASAVIDIIVHDPEYMTLKQPLLRSFTFLLLAFPLLSSSESQAQRGRANVLYSDRPMPIRLGIEIGTTLPMWMSAEPTMFVVKYPYSDGPDTTHMRFPDGFQPLFGMHFGIAADFSITEAWSILTKLNYNDRRGNWNTTEQLEYDDGTGNSAFAPLTNDYTLTLRYITLEAFAKYSFESLGGLCLGGGPAFNFKFFDHYDVRQTLGGPEDLSFVDFSTGQATGVRDYRVGYEYDKELNSFLFELKALVGYPIPIGYRWTVNPEITVALPITQVFSSSARDTYKLDGFNNTPNPLTLAGILALRYEL